MSATDIKNYHQRSVTRLLGLTATKLHNSSCEQKTIKGEGKNICVYCALLCTLKNKCPGDQICAYSAILSFFFFFGALVPIGCIHAQCSFEKPGVFFNLMLAKQATCMQL
jgi:hypothetical protein